MASWRERSADVMWFARHSVDSACFGVSSGLCPVRGLAVEESRAESCPEFRQFYYHG